MILEFPATYCHLARGSHKFTYCIFKKWHITLLLIPYFTETDPWIEMASVLRVLEPGHMVQEVTYASIR